MTNILPLPVEVEEITPEWMTAVLRQEHPDVTIKAVEITEEIRGTCTKLFLRLERDEAAVSAGIPETMLLKGGFEPHSRNPNMHHMHQREVRGYSETLPALGLHHPKCYFAKYDDQVSQGIILMEDLKAKGATFCNALSPQSFEQVVDRMTALARFHARTWDSDAIRADGRWADLPNFFEVMNGFFYEKANEENWARFCSMPRGASCSTRFLDRQWMVDSWERLKIYAADMPHCVLHGDIHLGNLYIDTDGTPGFFDTISSLGPGMLELSYHVSVAVDIADRPAWEGALVQRYLDELRASGIAAPDFETAMEQYTVMMVYGHFIWMTTEARYQPESINTANCARMTGAMLDNGLIATLDKIPLPAS